MELERITRMSELRDLGVSLFLGPDNPGKTEALLTGAWNLPMMTFVRRLEKQKPL